MKAEELCLPKERTVSVLTKSIRAKIWSSAMVNKALGVKNDNEARVWFAAHPDIQEECEELNKELLIQIEAIIKRGELLLSEKRMQEMIKTMDEMNF